MSNGNGAQVTIPTLDRMFFGETVAAEQLHAIGSDLHGFFSA
jgi:hypothetical protein